MSKRILTFLGLSLGFVWAGSAKAICPICVVAIGGGLELSRWLGVDDAVSSIWIGALLVALIGWTMIEMRKHNWKFPLDTAVISLAYYLLTFIPLYYYKIIGIAGYSHKVLGIDKIIFGTTVGTIVFLLSYWFHLYLKKKNNGKSFFPYQKVVLPIVALLLTSLVFFVLISWKII